MSSAFSFRMAVLGRALFLLWSLLSISPMVQGSPKHEESSLPQQPSDERHMRHRSALQDDTLGNHQDKRQYESYQAQQPQDNNNSASTQQQAPQNNYPPLVQHGAAAHHTFASARHDHQNLHYDEQPQQPQTTSSSQQNGGGLGVASVGTSDKSVMVTPWNHVMIQDAFLPYGSQGRPHCDGRQLIVTCQPDTEVACYYALDETGVEIVKTIKGTDLFVICVATNDEALVEKVEALDTVKSLEDDPIRDLAFIRGSKRKLLFHRPAKHGKDASGVQEQRMEYGLSMLQVPEFWEAYETRGEGITICIVDTGLRASHEDIPKDNTSGSDDVDLVNPWNQDGYTHGTHVTGIVAAMDNAIGVVGVAPKVKLFITRIFDDEGVFRASSLIEAMKECHDVGGADIINMSIGGSAESQAERLKVEELANLGVLIVSAAGNHGGEEGGNFLSYPGAYQDILSVGAVNENEQIAQFSCFNDQVSVTGPGVDVLSTAGDEDDGYTYLSGTSQASPYIAGVAALLMSQFPDKTADEIWNAMTATAKDKGACGDDPLFGAGIVQTLDAAKYLEGSQTEQASASEASCISTKITVQIPSQAGNATRYDITLKEDPATLVYRGGVFEEGELYTHDIALIDDCYEFTFWDTFENGFQEEGGYYELEYNGVQVLYSNEFSGSKQTVTFGTCCSTTPEVASVAAAPAKEAPASGATTIETTPATEQTEPASHHDRNTRTRGDDGES